MEKTRTGTMIRRRLWVDCQDGSSSLPTSMVWLFYLVAVLGGYMANKVDVRIVKSKDSLMTALVNLLLQKNLEDLTISEICQEADVNRNTFYSHYTSVRELFEEMKGKYMESLLASSKVFDEPNDSISKSLINILDKMKEESNMTKVILSQTNTTKFLNMLLHFALPQIYTMKSKSELLSSGESQAFVLGGVVNLIHHWVETDFQESPKNLGKRISTFIDEFFSL